MKGTAFVSPGPARYTMPGTLPVNSEPSFDEVTLSGCTPLPSIRISPRTASAACTMAPAASNASAVQELAFISPRPSGSVANENTLLRDGRRLYGDSGPGGGLLRTIETSG